MDLIKNDIFSVSKISSLYLATPIDFTDDQNNVRKVIWGYIYTLTIRIRIKDETLKFFTSLLYKQPLRNVMGRVLHLLGKNT